MKHKVSRRVCSGMRRLLAILILLAAPTTQGVAVITDSAQDSCTHAQGSVCPAPNIPPGNEAIDILEFALGPENATHVVATLHVSNVSKVADAIGYPNPDLFCGIRIDAPAGALLLAFDYKNSWIAQVHHLHPPQGAPNPFTGALTNTTGLVPIVDVSNSTLRVLLPRPFLGATRNDDVLSGFAAVCGAGGYGSTSNGQQSQVQLPMSDDAPDGAASADLRSDETYTFGENNVTTPTPAGPPPPPNPTTTTSQTTLPGNGPPTAGPTTIPQATLGGNSGTSQATPGIGAFLAVAGLAIVTRVRRR